MSVSVREGWGTARKCGVPGLVVEALLVMKLMAEDGEGKEGEGGGLGRARGERGRGRGWWRRCW